MSPYVNILITGELTQDYRVDNQVEALIGPSPLLIWDV